MVKFRVISREEWERMPARKPTKKPNAWDEVLGMVANGEVVEIEANDEKDLKGKRISLGRSAKAQGLRLEFRSQGNILAVCRSDQALPENGEKASKPAGGKRKQPEQTAEEAQATEEA